MGMEFSETLTDVQVSEIESGLDAHSADIASARSITPLRAGFIDAGRVVAGIAGTVYWGKLHIRLLWVHPQFRGLGLAARLMDWVEQRGRDLGCTASMVDTMSFQAPAFYERRGYCRFGVSAGYEGGASRHYFEKIL